MRGLMKGQADVSIQRGMPTENVRESQLGRSISESSVQIYYYNSGVLTADAGQAVGTSVVAKLQFDKILNALGDVVGNISDKSLAFTSTAFTTEVEVDPDLFEKFDHETGANKMANIIATIENSAGRALANGEYVVDYRTGTLYGKKASTQSTLTSVSYKISGGYVSGATSNSTTVTGMANSLPMARYNASPTARTEGQFGNLQADANGNLNVNLATTISGEDQTNLVMKTVLAPLSVSTYTPDLDVSSALEASSVTKASAGVLYGINSFSNTNAGGRWLQFFNSTTVPADTTVPVLEFYVGAEGTMPPIVFPMGIYFSTGIAWCNSSTNGAKTVGSADSLASISYK